MDLKTYYQKIRDEEAAIPTPYVVVRSLKTDAGGKGGVSMEVARRLAAKMLAEGSVQLATAEEAAAYYQGQAAALKAVQDAAEAATVAVTVVSSEDLKRLSEDMRKLKGGAKASKE